MKCIVIKQDDNAIVIKSHCRRALAHGF